MNEKYRLIIYAAVAIMHFYNGDISTHAKQSVADFRKENPKVIDRVFDEVMGTFQYAMSGEQINRAIYSYMSGLFFPQSIDETEPYEYIES